MTRPASVWYTVCPAPTPLSLAWRLGWIGETFARHGVAVESLRDSPSPEVRASHFDHSLDWSFRQGGCIPPLWARAGGRETRLIGVTETPEFQALVGRPHSGVARAADLAGRPVGVPLRPGAAIDFHRATALKGIASALTLEGLTLADVELVDLLLPDDPLAGRDPARHGPLGRRLPYGGEIRSLLACHVDAIFVKGAEGVIAANLAGAVVLAETGFHPDPAIRANNGTPRPLTLDARFAEEAPDLAADLAATVARAGAWAEAHPDAALRFVAQEIGASEAAVAAAMGPDLHRHLRLDLAPEAIDGLSAMGRFLAEQGFAPAEVDVAAWVHAAPLAAAA